MRCKKHGYQCARFRRLANAGKRRALALGVAAEDVDLCAIIDRHGLVCHICKKPILDDPSNYRIRLHFDHVIPLSQGGGHTSDNILPAHSNCNINKERSAV